MRNLHPYFKAALAAIACAGIAACGGDSSTAPTPTPAAAAPVPVTTVVAQGSFSGLPPFTVYATLPFTTSNAGRLDVTVDWTLPRCDIDVFVVRGTSASCSLAQFTALQCDIVTYSDSVTTKPEKVSVASLAPGTYSLYIVNWGPETEAFSYQALLTTGGPTLTSASRTQSRAPAKVGATQLIVER